MPEIEEEITIEFNNSQMAFIPCKSGCKLVFNDLNLSQAEAATMTWLEMNGPMLKIEISKATE